MKFTVHRTSGGWFSPPPGGEEAVPPCAGATREKLPCSTWGSRDYWTIEVPDLDALLGLADKLGHEIIVTRPDAPTGLPDLEIYDEDRE